MSDHFGNITIDQEAAQPKKSAPPKRRVRRQAPQKPSRHEKNSSPLFVSSVIFFMFLICYGTAGYFGVPKLLSSWLPEKVREEAGLELSIQSIAFNPFTFALRMDSVDFFDAPSSQTPFVSLKSLTTQLAPLSLLRGDLVTKNLSLKELSASIIRNRDKSYNVSPIMKKLRSSDNADFMDFSELPFLFSLNNITISDSRITFEDIPNSNTHRVEKIALTLPNLSNFSYQAANYIEPSFFAVVNGSPVKLTGQAAISGKGGDGARRQTNLACQLNHIDVSRYFGYLPANLPLKVTEGTADGTLILTFIPGAKDEKLLVEFSLQVTDLELRDENKRYSLRVPSAKFEGAVQPVKGDTHIKQIVLREPDLRSLDGHLLKIPSLFSYQQNTNTDPDLPAKKRAKFIIDFLIADNGSYSTFAKENGKDLDKWKNIQLSLKNFTATQETKTGSEQPSFRVSAERSKGHAALNWQGQIKPRFHLAGNLRIDSLPTAELFNWLDIQDFTKPSGTANLEAHLDLEETGTKEKPISMTVREGSIVLHDLSLGHEKSQWYTAPITRLDNFSASDSRISLGDIRLKNSSVSLDVSSLPPIFSQLGKTDSKISLRALEFTGALRLSESSKDIPPLNFNRVSLQAINLDDPAKNEERDNLTFKAGFADKGEIQAKGKVTLSKFSTFLTTAFTDLPASRILPWLGKNDALTRTGGALSGKGTFLFPELSFSGQLEINKGRFGLSAPSFISWEKLALKNFRFTGTPLYIGASEAAFSNPVIPYVRDDGSKHPAALLADFFSSQIPAEKDDKESSVSLSTLEIPKVSVTGGTVNIAENRLTPAWKATVSYFRGTVDNLVSKRSGETASPFSFSGSLDGIPFTLEGQFDPFDINAQGNSLFNMKGYPLPAFQKQLLKTIDIDSSLGEFSLTTRSDWNEGQVSKRHQILFQDVKPLSDVSESALTLALLTDNDQRFELLVNSRNYFEENSDPLFTETMTSFQKLMVKTSFSPYLIAAGDFRDLQDIEYAEFIPGQIVLSDQGQRSLARFAALLSEHPNLSITITGGVDSIIDRSALYDELDQVEQERVSAENHRRAMALNEAREKYTKKILEEREQNGVADIVEIDLPPELLAPFTPLEPEPVVIEDSMLENLAAKRAQVIVDFFTTKLTLEPERIKIAPHQILSEDNTNGNKVVFKLGVY